MHADDGLACGHATTKHAKTALQITPKPTGTQQASSQDCTPSLCYQAKYARLSKHQLTCHDMTTAYMLTEAMLQTHHTSA
jgi:hypothetical protein